MFKGGAWCWCGAGLSGEGFGVGVKSGVTGEEFGIGVGIAPGVSGEGVGGQSNTEINSLFSIVLMSDAFSAVNLTLNMPFSLMWVGFCSDHHLSRDSIKFFFIVFNRNNVDPQNTFL